MKLAHEVMGVVLHGQGNFLYIFHEGVGGSKTSDHTISCLHDAFANHMPEWVTEVVQVLDNAQINKNQFVVAYLA